MKVYIKPVCPEMMGAFSAGNYEVETDSSVYTALVQALRQYGGDDVLFDSLKNLVFLLNGKRVSLDTPASEGDSILALRPAYGG